MAAEYCHLWRAVERVEAPTRSVPLSYGGRPAANLAGRPPHSS